jgi:hypothetical protein
MGGFPGDPNSRERGGYKHIMKGKIKEDLKRIETGSFWGPVVGNCVDCIIVVVVLQR